MEGNFRDIFTLVLCLGMSLAFLGVILWFIFRKPDPPVVIDETWVKPIQTHFTGEELSSDSSYIDAFNGFYEGKYDDDR